MIYSMSLRLAVLTLILSSCSLLPSYPSTVEFPLLPPSTLGATRSTLQVVHGAYGEQDAAFQCVVDVGPQHLTLVGLSAQGQRLFSLRHDGRQIEVQRSPLTPEQLDPKRVLTDLQFALWPLSALQQALAGSIWQVSEPTPATRRLRRESRLIAEVHYHDADPWKGRFWLSNFEFGYSLFVASQPLP